MNEVNEVNIVNVVEAFVTQNPLYQQYTRIPVRKLVLHSVGCPQPSAAVFARQWQTARYFAQRQALGEKGAAEWNNYLPLSYREVSYGPVMKGANGFFPYDDILNEEQRNDIQDFFADTLNTERAEDFTQFILAEYTRRDLRFRVCKFCGRYFGIMGNTRLEFCDRLIDGSTKTCKEMGSLRLYEKRKLEEPAIKEYKRSYKAHNARIRYGLMTREEFNTWSQEARRKRDDCVAGKLSLEEFVAWLDSDRQS